MASSIQLREHDASVYGRWMVGMQHISQACLRHAHNKTAVLSLPITCDHRKGWRCARDLGAAAIGTGLLAASCVTADDRLPGSQDKLSCKKGADQQKPAVLVSCGSFNPPTIMHLRMFELAAQELKQRGFDVWGGYISPVSDFYAKPGLESAKHRVAMCKLASDSSDIIMVDPWEAQQPRYSFTLTVLRHVRDELNRQMNSALSAAAAATQPTIKQQPFTEQAAQQQHAPAAPSAAAAAAAAGKSEVGQQQKDHDKAHAGGTVGGGTVGTQRVQVDAAAQPSKEAGPAGGVQVMLLCGADVLASLADPGAWHNPELVLQEHGVVCVAREGTERLQELFEQPGNVLHTHRDKIIVVRDAIPNGVSSTKVRQELRMGRSVKYFVPDAVIAYIKANGFYGTAYSS